MKAMRMILLHGRADPEEGMDDWGYIGPHIDGITAIHWTYGTMNAYFDTVESARRAQEKTGWNWWDDAALEIAVHGPEMDLIYTDDPEMGRVYWGDFEFQTVSGQGEEVGNVE